MDRQNEQTTIFGTDTFQMLVFGLNRKIRQNRTFHVSVCLQSFPLTIARISPIFTNFAKKWMYL